MRTEVENLFHELADLPPEARSQYFADHHVDEETRQEVETLLTFDSGASSVLARGVSMAASQALPQLDPKGWRCGPYRLLNVIGRGGMSAVYLAERVDGEVTQRLAVKLLPPGAGDSQRERFLQERQILASLAHPNIARMLDAGHVENGQPFLAMEFVAGKPIDEFAADLGTRDKIALMRKVCSAVAYLHQNLVVHRDLKPSNILVTVDGEPKLLDFGIAKILDVATDTTITNMRMLTPDYASPEQVVGSRVSTATDIYGLGAVLYKLLTRRPPHEFEERSAEAIASAICTRDVKRPSQWAPELKGDLEAILLRALRRDPRERYATVEQFAEDLDAFLQLRPVKARVGNVWYRTRKFVRRYWAPVAAAALVMVSLSAGLYVANRQRIIAERRFAQLRQISSQLIDFEMQLSAPNAATDLKLHRRLIATSIQYLKALSREGLFDKTIDLQLASAYLRVARIQGVPEWNQQGHYAEAEESLSQAESFANAAQREDPTNREMLWILANVAHDRAVTAYAERNVERVLTYSPRAVAGFTLLARLGNLTRREINGATYIYGDLAEVHLALHRFADAERYARLGIDFSQNNATVPGPRAQAFNMLAGALTDQGDLPGAMEAIRQARWNWEKLMPPEPAGSGYAQLILSQTRLQEGLTMGEEGGVSWNRPVEAAAALKQAYAAMDKLVRDPNDYEARSFLATDGRYLGDVLRRANPRAALEVYGQSIKRIHEVPDDISARRLEARLLASSSYAVRWLNLESDARARIDGSFRLLRETKDYPAEKIELGSEADTAVRALADDYAETDQPGKAVETYQELLRKIMAANPNPENDLVNAAHLSRLYSSLASALRRVGRTGEAVALENTRLDLWRHWDSKLSGNPFVQRQLAAAGTR